MAALFSSYVVPSRWRVLALDPALTPTSYTRSMGMHRLPAPLHNAAGDAQEEPSRVQQQQQQQSTALAVQLPQIPPYGQRKGWKPKSQLDFGDGGSYPECHCAQYPLELGRKKVSPVSALSLSLTGLTNRLWPK